MFFQPFTEVKVIIVSFNDISFFLFDFLHFHFHNILLFFSLLLFTFIWPFISVANAFDTAHL